MVSSEWKKLNSKVSILETKKKFFNKYYYNIKYQCPGGRIILRPDIDDAGIAEAIHYRQEQHRSYNYGGSWRASRQRLEEINLEQLSVMLSIKKSFSQQFLFRVEEPYITIYSADESLLFNVADAQLTNWSDKLVSVKRPASNDIKAILDTGAIIVKNKINYRYKFVCKDGTCSNKKSLYSYLDHLGDQVKVSGAVWNMLEKNGNFIWGVWFYGNDLSLANMLNIIEPGFVTNIHEVVIV